MAPSTKNTTPGRRKKTGQQYFDVGKVGRKTGITLQDTGIRDEHGLEPVSGIFSSPTSPEQNGGATLTSDGMDVQESSAPDVTTTLGNRKTPRLPPARQSPMKRTSIGGSPKRMSSVRPQSRPAITEEPASSPRGLSEPAVNRKLQFETVNRNRKSIHVVDSQSPFKPKHKLRRSTGPGRPDPYDYEDDEDDAGQAAAFNEVNGLDEDEDDSIEQSIENDDQPLMIDDNDVPEAEENDQSTVSVAEGDASSKRKRGRPRKSDQSNTSQAQLSPVAAPSSGTKRARTSLANSRIEEDPSSRPAKKKRTSNISVRPDDEVEAGPSNIPVEDDYVAFDDEDDGHQPLLDSQLDSQPEPEPGADTEPAKKGRGKGKGKAKKGKATALREADANRTIPRGGSPVNASGSPVKGRGTSMGPVSNVNLRAHTPAADAHEHTSRSGRNLIQPLKFWENEGRIWRNGEIEGIIRAEHVEQSKARTKKRKKTRKNGSRLRDIEEESETESTMPDEWEEQAGVITGNVANWNAETKQGDPEDPIQEDLAFAASSIVTRDVAGSDFKYAKIMTIPFFGAGVVELPPEGFKRAKNSRKMQMVFFVHEGKVMVEVGATGMEVNQFALSKGGCWVVPRGNNYAITNESRTRTARIFFAQGCEVESSG
ncbi:Putative centromere protein C/Mif2/cnp3 [Septoria linicola]|uniref:Centromere protein C/Mif2/cnp3 n=1 Tax=Septoria linicola TaxID=215465 RepID=A0A9Q9AN47_9PEZI|nr:putative centromere protein C/Mif2/cnp3 [Septoria linicola]USW50003.1 Putative centromere protein C/Mif2/cnp3 [Septoria linicola]